MVRRWGLVSIRFVNVLFCLFRKSVAFLFNFTFDLFLFLELFNFYSQKLLFLLFRFYLLVYESLWIREERCRLNLIIFKMVFLFFQFMCNAIVILTWKINIFSSVCHVLKLSVNFRKKITRRFLNYFLNFLKFFFLRLIITLN